MALVVSPCSHYTISRLQRLHQYQHEPPDQHVRYLTDSAGVCALDCVREVWKIIKLP